MNSLEDTPEGRHRVDGAVLQGGLGEPLHIASMLEGAATGQNHHDMQVVTPPPLQLLTKQICSASQMPRVERESKEEGVGYLSSKIPLYDRQLYLVFHPRPTPENDKHTLRNIGLSSVTSRTNRDQSRHEQKDRIKSQNVQQRGFARGHPPYY